MTVLGAAISAAGVVQLMIAAANVKVAQTLDYRANLERLTPLVGQIFLVHALYIGLVILWFGALCLVFGSRLASGDPLARFLTGGLAAFWGLRAVIQVSLYDKKVGKQHRPEDVAFLAACALLTGIFLTAAVH
jgi:hypothetical protein